MTAMIVAQAMRGELDRLTSSLAKLKPMVDRHVTRDRVLKYLEALAGAPAPSTAASAIRTPILRKLIEAEGSLGQKLVFDPNFKNSGSTVLLTRPDKPYAPLWYFAHLDTISYLVKPRVNNHYPLVPFCFHLTKNGSRTAQVIRFDLSSNAYQAAGMGRLVSQDGEPAFVPADPDFILQPGDRVVPVSALRLVADRKLFGQLDNAGGVAALAVAAPILAEAGVAAMLAFPDEEEGPVGSGNQVMGRGGSRIISMLPPPDLAIVIDMQQAGDGQSSLISRGAVVSEFASLARGAVTPPDLYALARSWIESLTKIGVNIRESNNAYTSRSDDVSVLLKTPNILLLGFPGLNRHFDDDEPSANLDDIVDLAKALVYVSAVAPMLRTLREMQHDG